MKRAALLALVACAGAPEPTPTAPTASVAAVPPEPPKPEAKPEPKPEPPRPEPPKAEPKPAPIDVCVKTNKVSACVPLFAGKLDDLDSPAVKAGQACTSGCLADRREERLRPVVDEALATCRKAKAKTCAFPKVVRPKDARIVSMKFQDALRAAVEKKDDASLKALDDTMPLLDAEYLASVEPDCSKKCREP